MGFCRQEYWSGLPFPSPGNLPHPSIELKFSALAGRFFTTEPPGKPSLQVPVLVQLLSRVRLFVTPWTAVHQASLSITNSWSLLKLTSIESVIPSNHLIFYCPLLLPASIISSIRVFPNESVLHIRWPKFWSFSFSVSPFNKYSDWIFLNIPLGLTGWISLQSKGLSRVFSNTIVQEHQFVGFQFSL